jgi:type I restriction enzyme R subunit
VLSQIIKYLNDHFGTDFTGEDKVFIRQFQARLSENATLENSIRVNTRENARLTFDHVAGDLMQDMINANFKFYKRVTDDSEFARVFYDFLFERYLQERDAA